MYVTCTNSQYPDLHKACISVSIITFPLRPHYHHCRTIHILSITEEPVSQSGRGKRQTGLSESGTLVLVSAERLAGGMVDRNVLATRIRETKDRIESILGGE